MQIFASIKYFSETVGTIAPTAPTLTQPLQLSNTTSNSALWRHRVIVGPVSTQIDLRSTKDPVAILKDPLQTSHPKVEQICCKNMLLISNDVSNFENV